MRSGWWIGVTAGVVLGLGGVAAVDVATQPAVAQSGGTATFAQLRQVQKVSIAALKRINADHKKLNRVAAQLPLWAVSSGAAGSNLIRGDGVVLSQRLTDGNYRVRFVRDVSQCTWSGTPATEGREPPRCVHRPHRARPHRAHEEPAHRAHQRRGRRSEGLRLPRAGVLLGGSRGGPPAGAAAISPLRASAVVRQDALDDLVEAEPRGLGGLRQQRRVGHPRDGVDLEHPEPVVGVEDHVDPV